MANQGNPDSIRSGGEPPRPIRLPAHHPSQEKAVSASSRSSAPLAYRPGASTGQMKSGLEGGGSGRPTAPPVYRPAGTGVSARTGYGAGAAPTLQRKQVTGPPPVYRPAASPIAPPAVYRPNVAVPLQRKAAMTTAPLRCPARAGVSTPMVYRPNVSASLQRKPDKGGLLLYQPSRSGAATSANGRLSGTTSATRQAGPQGDTSFRPQGVPRPGRGYIFQSPANPRFEGGSGQRSSTVQPMFSNLLREFKGIFQTDQEQIQAILDDHPNLEVVWVAIPQGGMPSVLAQMKRYLAGNLVVWRGVQQCHPSFPNAPHTTVTPKNPGSLSAPDFANNDNDWVPFYEDQAACLSVALSWSHSIVGYFNNGGGMDSNRPVALVLQKTLGPLDRVAFGMYPEVQVKGTTTVAVLHSIGIDTDWSTLNPIYNHGECFRAKATTAAIPIH
jgi:hypothetical protein